MKHSKKGERENFVWFCLVNTIEKSKEKKIMLKGEKIDGEERRKKLRTKRKKQEGYDISGAEATDLSFPCDGTTASSSFCFAFIF